MAIIQVVKLTRSREAAGTMGLGAEKMELRRVRC